ncbi:hypothetical protein N7504_008638 [Penicillium tannophilum]|nr:hypothetical protein N7504_008638 [Penicillium tannophilum]
MGNYGLSATDGRDIVIVMVVLGFLAILSTILRVISRRMRGIKLGWDDNLMMIATCFVIASTVMVIMTVTKGGVGRHAKYVAASDQEFVLKVIVPCQILYGIGLAIVKTSIMILYYKLFGTKKSMRIAIYSTGAIVWAWAFSILIESLLLCQPVAFNWDQTIPGGKCGDRNAAFVVAGVLNMVTDFMVMSLPIPYILKLQLPIGRKVGLLVTFLLGLFVSAISMVRVVSLMRINFADVTYSLPLPLMWSIIEEQLAIVASNLPLLRRVFSAIIPGSWLGSSNHESGWSNRQTPGRKSLSNHFTLTRMDIGVNNSQVTSGHAKHSSSVKETRWSDDGVDGQSDTDLASNGAPPGGIHMSKDFRVESDG